MRLDAPVFAQDGTNVVGDRVLTGVFRYANGALCREELEAAGFRDVHVGELAMEWRSSTGADDLIAQMRSAGVRSRALFAAQTDEITARVRDGLAEGLERFPRRRWALSGPSNKRPGGPPRPCDQANTRPSAVHQPPGHPSPPGERWTPGRNGYRLHRPRSLVKVDVRPFQAEQLAA